MSKPQTPAPAVKITAEKRGHLLLIGFNRAAKGNAFDVDMLQQLAHAFEQPDA